MPKAISSLKSNKKIAVASKPPTSAGTKNAIFNTSQFGQHILKNPQVAQAIVDKANLKTTDKVLEVGPGTGNLTVRILEQCKQCTAVEMDPRMAAELSKRVQGSQVQKKLDIIVGDFIKTDLEYFDVCISNTPYQISSPLTFKLLSQRPLFRVAILMFQQEFAQRLLAKPGSKFWCRLSANVQLYSKIDHILKVGRNNFKPPPQVDSSVVRIQPIDPPPAVKFEEFDGLTRILFNRRNKTVHANFQARGIYDMLRKNWITDQDKTDVEQVVNSLLSESGYSEQRAAKMEINDFLTLLAAFNKIGMHFS